MKNIERLKPRAKKSALTILSSIIPSLIFTPLAHGEMAPPQVGAQFEFQCAVNGTVRPEKYEIKSVDGDVVHVIVTYESKYVNYYKRPYYLGGTTVSIEQRVGKFEASMSSYDGLAGLQALEIGSTHRAWVIERRSNNLRLNWNYTVKVNRYVPFYDMNLGEIETIELFEERWVGIYKSKFTAHYAPAYHFPVYWKYSDTNDYEHECTLTDARLPDGPELVVATTGAGDTGRTPRAESDLEGSILLQVDSGVAGYGAAERNAIAGQSKRIPARRCDTKADIRRAGDKLKCIQKGQGP